MRGRFQDQGGLFSYIRPEERIPAVHPLREIRKLVREVLKELSHSFGKLYSHEGRPSIPPEQLLSALLLQVFYSIRSERQLMEQLDYNLLFRWFVDLSANDSTRFGSYAQEQGQGLKAHHCRRGQGLRRQRPCCGAAPDERHTACC